MALECFNEEVANLDLKGRVQITSSKLKRNFSNEKNYRSTLAGHVRGDRWGPSRASG